MTGDQQFSATLHEQLDVNFALQAAGLGVWEYNPVTGLIDWDRQTQALFGIADSNSIPYEQAIRHIHPDDVQRVDEAVQWAVNPQSGGIYDQTYRTIGVDDGMLRWVRFAGRTYRTESGELIRFGGITQEVTQQVTDRQKISDDARLADLVKATPAATAVYMGRDMLIQQVNTAMLAIWGKDESVIGKTLHVAIPELDGQPFLAQLQHVFDTGEPFRQAEGMAELIENGQPRTVWFNHAYNPLYDSDGQIYGVINIAIDVTEQVLIRQTLQNNEIALNNTIELAELGTFSVDVATNLLTASPRVADWFGFDKLTANTEAFISGVGEGDRDHVRTSLYNTLLPGSDGRYDVIHSAINAKTGNQVILHAMGRVYFAPNGQPVKIEGTAQDITAQRELQLLLEQQVQERTGELATTNRELAASNEEYASINEELEEANNLLTRSNENLQTFAYIASHDLQEPLRKIQQFGDLLKTRLAGQVDKDELTYLERMQVAASRMSILIKDLLDFSRISTQRSIDELVALQTVTDAALTVLDWTITETEAQVAVDALPTVRGDAVQLGQLFQNLISNALKFRQPGVPPAIRISSHIIRAEQLPASIKPARRMAFYCRIDVADNGIGFEEKYLDRIFQVFQRLHGKDQYAGTGVGLAICEKVVANHGGAITAISQPGLGATFMIYLPAD
ncbi:PAS domain-containing sensor histidine kinase [Spirosoma rhododendri]|uniref:histidine kinase n=1 Tax=Spirosoma rhododendri TaxID=2728024 RepID=A0A7L5DNU1_9BACT|nr:ATP-binding protein [Spirosoma rhododendri]QJD80164.1 PAS domain-containing protein [Spirosoma rhododendri]